MDQKATRWCRIAAVPVLVMFFALYSSCACATEVTYDGRSLIIGGQRRLLFSGSIHYTRSTPEMWPALISRAKKGGIDVIQTYVFWNVHEPQQGQYDFRGRNDIVAFMKAIQAQGLYCSLRIGPFIQSEWKYGGFPLWLRDVPGIVFRSDNQPFKYHMQRFTSKIVAMMKAEKLYASQGGPIIMSQIENEYQNVQAAYHEKATPYVRWAASMAVGLNTGVPWVMCKQSDAPNPVINTCNGRNCGETFQGPNSPAKPSMWTENWTAFYQVYGKETPKRSAEDIAFGVALFIAAKKGSFVNYYMYHGGTNFGRYASEFVTTSYYDQAPLDEYGFIRQPKWGHLRELHAVIKQSSSTILQGSYSNFSPGQQQEVHLFQRATGQCVAFIVNKDGENSAAVRFRNIKYVLPARSISILPDCRKVAFNTAKVSAQYGLRTAKIAQAFNSPQAWQAFPDRNSNYGKVSLVANALLDQLDSTKDESDYLWYSTSFEHVPSKDQLFLHVYAQAHVVHAFVNGMYLGYSHGNHDAPGTYMDKAVTLKNGKNTISLLSVMVGTPDSGAYLERRVAGLRKVKIQSNGKKPLDMGYFRWEHQVGLGGEKLKLYTKDGSNKVAWGNVGNFAQKPLIWYKTTFNAPPGDKTVVLNLRSMGKGEAWINGESIGRYWVSFTTAGGQPSQSLYHIPASFLRPQGNLLVLLEEIGGDPLGISLQTVSITGICGAVSEKHPSSLFSNHKRPSVELQCPSKTTISAIKFASYGSPVGHCESESYAIGRCHSAASRAVVEKACLGKSSCSVLVSNAQFGGDPCPRTIKSLVVAASCH